MSEDRDPREESGQEASPISIDPTSPNNAMDPTIQERVIEVDPSVEEDGVEEDAPLLEDDLLEEEDGEALEMTAEEPPDLPDDVGLVAEEPPMIPLEPEPTPAPGSQQERMFYQREALALAEKQPERAALVWLEAASAAERADSAQELVLSQVEAALELRPDSSWLLPLARRLLMRQQQYDRALELCRREVDLGGENAIRAAVLREAAALVRHQLADPPKALALVENALKLQPGEISSLSDAINLRLELGNYAEAAEALEQVSVALTSPEERARHLYAAGTIRECRLDQPDQAESDYRRSVEADRENLAAELELSFLHERRNQWIRLCKSLEHLAQLTEDATVKARLLHQAGSLHLDRTGDLEAASHDLTRAAESDPTDTASLQRLAYVHEARGKTRELVDVMKQLLEHTLDASGRAALLSHMGWLLQSRLGEVDEAAEAFQAALDEVEGYLPAIQSLGTLLRQKGEFESLLEIYAPEVEGTLPQNARAMRSVEMGDILLNELHRPDEARLAYRRALELDPDLLLAFWGLYRLLQKLQLDEELAQLLMSRAHESKDNKTRNHLLLVLARLQDSALGEPDQAIRTLEGLEDPDQTRSVAAERLELYEQTGRSAEKVAFLLAQAEDTQDQAEAQGRRLQAATELELELEEYDQALEIYRQVLAENPQSVAAIRGAGRIYHRLGWWNDLVKLHYHELVTNKDRPDAPILLCRIGRILEENLGQTSAAIKAYSKALERDPRCAPALPALERLVRMEKRWGDLVEVLKTYASARLDRTAAADALCRAAEVADCQLGNLDLALDLYSQARDLQPGSHLARQGRLRVFRRQENWTGVAEMLEELVAACESDEERCILQLHLARVKEHRLGQPPDLELYLAAAESPMLKERLQTEITRVKRAVGTRELASWLLNQGQRARDPSLAVALLMESTYISEFASEDGVESSLEAARLAYSRKPEDVGVIWSLERALCANRQWNELGELREKEAQLELDPTVRVVKLSSAAMAFQQAGAAEEATRLAQECLNFDAHCLPALKVLASLAEDREDWSRVASLCDRLAEACTDPDNRLEHCMRAAELWSAKLGDTSRALSSLSVALINQPGQTEAFTRAERLLRDDGDFAELSRLYNRRIMSTEDPADKIALLRQHADLLRTDLNDDARAIMTLNELLALAPNDLTALDELSTLLMSQSRWSDAAVKLGLLMEASDDPEVCHRTRLRQAGLFLRHLHQPAQARESLESALDEHPNDIETCKMMVELASNEGSWEEAQGLLERVATSDERQVQVWATMKLAEVARRGLRDEGLQQRYEVEAFELVANDPDELAVLIERFVEAGEQRRLVELTREVLKSYPDESSGAIHLRSTIARLMLEQPGQEALALEQIERCLAGRPGDQELKLLHATALEQTGADDAAVKEYRGILGEDASSVGALRGLSRVMNRQGQHETVAAAASMVDLLGEADPEETALLKGLQGAMSPAGQVRLDSMPIPGELRPLQDVLKQVQPYLESVYPTTLPDVLPADHPVAVACNRLARPFGLGEVHVALQSQTAGATAGLGDPVPLILEPRLSAEPSSARFRFWVGRALCSVATSCVVAERLKQEDSGALSDLLLAICTSRPSTRSAQLLRKRLSKILPRKLRKQLESLHPPTSPGHLASYRSTEQQRADQVGLLMCRDPGQGIAELGRALGLPGDQLTSSKRLVELMQYVISDGYASAARSLWS